MKCIYPSAVSSAWVTGDIWLTRVWTCLVTVITVPSPGAFYIKKRSKLCVYWIKQVVDLFIIYWEFEQQIWYIITHTHLHLFCDVMIFYIHKNSNSYIPVNSVQYISYEQKKDYYMILHKIILLCLSYPAHNWFHKIPDHIHLYNCRQHDGTVHY